MRKFWTPRLVLLILLLVIVMMGGCYYTHANTGPEWDPAPPSNDWHPTHGWKDMVA